MNNEVMVSICCLAYNQEKYIKKTLDSFLMQKCDFKFEVIVHDDASTDNTADIIKEYEKNYPELITAVCQTENQYSKGGKIFKNFVYPHAKGKYIAFCEGDDYWIDPLKLQKQVDALEKNDDCSMCICRVKGVFEDETPANKNYPNFDMDTGVKDCKSILEYICTNDYVFQTSSYFFIAEKLKEFANNSPRFAQVSPTGDLSTMMYFLTLGNIYYIDEEMSCYRLGSKSSEERKKTYTGTEEKIVIWFNRQIKMMEEFDKYTNGQYHDLCQRKINGYHFDRAVRNKNYKEMIKPQYHYFIKDYTIKEKIALFINARLPFFRRFI